MRIALLLAMVCLLLPIGCASQRPRSDEASHWRQARQLLLVTTADWNADRGLLRRYERTTQGWRVVGDAQPVLVGRNGSAWGLGLHDAGEPGPVKREGDARSPAGVFSIGEAFGYAPKANTALAYAPMQASSYCVDVSGSPLYNRIVDADVVGTAAVAQATEPMRRDLHADGDQRYRLGFVIEHNLQAQPMGGSCIFAHLWKSPDDPTTGCTAMAPAAMDAVLAWLRPERDPVFVLLPVAEYARLRFRWELPVVE